MPERILILGGTREAAELARELVASGHEVTTSLAGRTQEPLPLAGSVRTGGFGGPLGMAEWMRAHAIERLIDATHPFATRISANAAIASAETGIELERRERPPWKKVDGDHWIEAKSGVDAAGLLPANARVLLALGSQHLAPFTAKDDVHFVIRMVDPPTDPLPFAQYDLILGRPSVDEKQEVATLRSHAISCIVCRNSGGPGAYAKIAAARALKLPVIMIARR